MNVTVKDAQHRLQDLVRRAEAGEEVVLTDDGRAAVKLVAVRKPWKDLTPDEREAVLRSIGERGREKALPGPSAAHAADFLYDENGLPA